MAGDRCSIIEAQCQKSRHTHKKAVTRGCGKIVADLVSFAKALPSDGDHWVAQLQCVVVQVACNRASAIQYIELLPVFLNTQEAVIHPIISLKLDIGIHVLTDVS